MLPSFRSNPTGDATSRDTSPIPPISAITASIFELLVMVISTTIEEIPSNVVPLASTLVNPISLAGQEVVICAVEMADRTALDAFCPLDLLLHPPSLLVLYRLRLPLHRITAVGVRGRDQNLAVVDFMAFLAALEASELIVFEDTLGN